MKIKAAWFSFLGLIALLFAFSVPAFAQAVAATAPAPAAPSLLSLLSGGNIAVLFGLVSSLIAIWKHKAASASDKQLTTAQKINQSLILGIETAGQIPEAAAAIDKVKAVVQAKATEYGVQPVLHSLVQTFTDPAATATATVAAK